MLHKAEICDRLCTLNLIFMSSAPIEDEPVQSRLFARKHSVVVVEQSTRVTHIPMGAKVEIDPERAASSCTYIRYTDPDGEQIVGFVSSEFLDVNDNGTTALVSRKTVCVTELEKPEQVPHTISPDREVRIVEDLGESCVVVDAFDLNGHPIRGLTRRDWLQECRPDCPRERLLSSDDLDPNPLAGLGRIFAELVTKLLRRRTE